MSESDMAHGALKFGLLGPFQASLDGETLALGGRRQRAILARLVCEAGHAMSVERLVDGVWGDPAPPGVVTSVQSYVFHLRQVLEPNRSRGTPASVLVTVPGGYRLAVDRQCIDVTRFEELVASGDAAAEGDQPGTAANAYRSALALWRGDVLEDLGDYEFVAPVRARLDEQRASVLESQTRPSSPSGTARAWWPSSARSSPSTPCAKGCTPSACSPSTARGGSRTLWPPIASCGRCWTRSWASNRAHRCRSCTPRSSGRIRLSTGSRSRRPHVSHRRARDRPRL